MGEAGGVPALLRVLLDEKLIHGDVMTVTGKTLRENLEGVTLRADQDVIRPISNYLSKDGGVVGLWGSLAPDGAIVKIAGMKTIKFRGPARVFDGEAACFEAVQKREYKEGEVLVIRYEGAKGGPGMRGNALHHGGAVRSGHGRQAGADHRRGVSLARRADSASPCRPGSCARRADRVRQERRHDLDRCGERQDRP